ncbi:MAG: 50S ribosomal protein L10 [Dehalococcoidales bacterium]|jgi:large subunit ribosomal protein L10|nr:50S ribosomal protein L10 [Dehalococcoidales bacterium]
MKREGKEQLVKEIREAIEKCSSGIMTDYMGMKNADLTTLRRKLGEAGIDYMVVKNTLAGFAAESANKAFIKSSLKGPMAIAFGYKDVIDPAKVLLDFINSSETPLKIKGGFIGDQLLTPDDVKTLATIPSKEVLLAQVLGGMQSPIAGFVNVCAAPIRGLVNVLQAKVDKLEGNQ